MPRECWQWWIHCRKRRAQSALQPNMIKIYKYGDQRIWTVDRVYKLIQSTILRKGHLSGKNNYINYLSSLQLYKLPYDHEMVASWKNTKSIWNDNLDCVILEEKRLQILWKCSIPAICFHECSWIYKLKTNCNDQTQSQHPIVCPIPLAHLISRTYSLIHSNHCIWTQASLEEGNITSN
jgi:hypothetical protein